MMLSYLLRLNMKQFEYLLTNGITWLLRTHVMYNKSCDRSKVDNPMRGISFRKEACKA